MVRRHILLGLIAITFALWLASAYADARAPYINGFHLPEVCALASGGTQCQPQLHAAPTSRATDPWPPVLFVVSGLSIFIGLELVSSRLSHRRT